MSIRLQNIAKHFANTQALEPSTWTFTKVNWWAC